ncbi:tRNA lysidine(34) synthetase TilS [Phycicoccus sp. CSK15P-2]|uniref:tRNA lysidine(34) synthetase TilS n=1 Tax=Phycicoccus sp. CSK15P-2 TaxID=2807627 RepID=UPI001950D4A6|nr:tRNA lysidine(34) synthetase TilS [Phycicoccus sp. CSK15P-2]MBM6405555.1 tRNA lysidine(34) synthetase TilS [Phycicoccus sp. CSK15P-2]
MSRPWGRPHPAVAAVRRAVRDVLAECAPGDLVLVACSGGADSGALLDAARFEGERAGVRVGAVVVDHGLRAGSADIARMVGEGVRATGLDPVEVVRVTVDGTGDGVEAAARNARYAALDAAADRHGARVVLLGHTLDDQAEQVLLGLARGSGARSLAGMPAVRGRYRRPLLHVTREQTRAACAAEGVEVRDDPMNDDPAFARVRARRALADLEADLGPGLAAALARSADRLRDDADHLDALAAEAARPLGPGPWPAETLLDLPRAVRTRVWRHLLVTAGAPAGQLSARHVDACDRLLTAWRGQGAVHAPGDLRVSRSEGRVSIAPAPLVE